MITLVDIVSDIKGDDDGDVDNDNSDGDADDDANGPPPFFPRTTNQVVD